MKTIFLTIAMCALAFTSCASSQCMNCKGGTCAKHPKPMATECAKCNDGSCAVHGPIHKKAK